MKVNNVMATPKVVRTVSGYTGEKIKPVSSSKPVYNDKQKDALVYEVKKKKNEPSFKETLDGVVKKKR